MYSPLAIRFSAFRARRGFTLLELLLALAIIGLIGTVLIGGSAQLLTDKPVTVDDVFWKAVAEARKQALKSGNEVRLTFVDDRDKGKSFNLSDGTAAETFPVPPTASDVTVSLLVAQKGGNAVLVGGQLVETQTVPFATFYADGTCTAFRAQFQRPSGVHTVAIDPWTCAPELVPPDPNAPPPAP